MKVNSNTRDRTRLLTFRFWGPCYPRPVIQALPALDCTSHSKSWEIRPGVGATRP